MLILARKDEGKSTILKVLSGFDDTYFGSIKLKNAEIKGINNAKKNFSLLLSDPIFLKNKSIRKNFDFLSKTLNLPAFSDDELNGFLDKFGINQSLKIKVKKLSLLNQRKLAILRSEIKNPNILFLDDQFVSLEGDENAEIFGIYKEILNSDKTVIMTLGDESYLKIVDKLRGVNFDKILYLNLAHGVCYDSIDEFENSHEDRDIFKFYKDYCSILGEIEKLDGKYFFVEENGKHRKFQNSFNQILDDLKIENGLSEKVELYYKNNLEIDKLSDQKFNDLISEKQIFLYLALDGKKVFKSF